MFPDVSYQKAVGAKYKYINTFTPLPWQREPWLDISPVMLLTGAAGGGKSYLAAEKIHGYCLKYPETMALVLRKTKESLRNSTVLMLDRYIIGQDPSVVHVKSDRRFEYGNGSILHYSGMSNEEQRERIRSMGQQGGIDIAWMEEATDFDEEDYNEVGARIRGTAAPWTQLILSCNPDGPLHWINLRLILGEEASVYYSSARDNLHVPPAYLDRLQSLTGVQYQRLVLGRWVLGSGIVFDTWVDEYNTSSGEDHGGNVTNRADYVQGDEVIWAIDDGYSGKRDKKTKMFTARSHPRAILIAQRRSNGIMAIIDEDYAIETLAVDHINQVRKRCLDKGWALPKYVVRDRAAASLDGALREVGIKAKYNQVDVDESIKELRTWIAPDKNGVRKAIVHPRCRFLRFEMAQFSVDKNEKIIKEHDNGPDAFRYLIWDESYSIRNEIDIVTWDMVAGD